MTDELTNKLILHMTSIHNAEAILQADALMAKSQLDAQNFTYHSIAHQNIQDRRLTTPVPCGSGGVLHDYVPFYFAPRSPMLYAIKNQRVDGFEGTQEDIIYWVSRIKVFVQHDIPFVFTDGHGTMAFSDFFESAEDLAHIDWPLMKEKYWYDTEDDNDRKRRRQAEFLVYKSCSLKHILGIVVKTEAMKQKLESLLEKHNFDIQVLSKSEWYF